MSSSRPQSPSGHRSPSPEKTAPSFSANRQQKLFHHPNEVTPGSLNDGALVRSVVTEAMKNSGLSRVQIAEEMSRLIGTAVTERQLNNFAADSREEYRFPCELERAFCVATGDFRLLTCRAELVGFQVIDETGRQLMELGREYLRQKRAASAVSALETQLSGVSL